MTHTGQCLCGAVEIARPGVVAKTLPMLEDIGFWSGCKGLDVGEAQHPAVKVGDDCSDSGLLEHEFGDEDFVGRRVGTPWQVPAVSTEPATKCLVEFCCWKFRYHLDMYEGLRAKA